VAAYSNQVLSQKRAESMVNYLVNNGISRMRLTAKGYGGSRPIAPNYQEPDRKNNRRIDFIIM
jgi:outer membrane protein OmpA-like peptidoglycan-associated protein